MEKKKACPHFKAFLTSNLFTKLSLMIKGVYMSTPTSTCSAHTYTYTYTESLKSHKKEHKLWNKKEKNHFWVFLIFFGGGEVSCRFHAERGAQGRAWTHNPEIKTWAEIKSQTPNQLSHAGAPDSLLIVTLDPFLTPLFHTLPTGAPVTPPTVRLSLVDLTIATGNTVQHTGF